jgi:lipopolysaccharide transport system ATP-binding protein
MYVRLAFAVAAHLEPEILIVDEVLAVGDAAFQKKCLGKMGEVARGGRTVLFVSHNMGAVQALCNRAIYLEKGTVKAVGEVEQLLRQYHSDSEASRTHRFDKALSLGADLTLHAYEFEPVPALTGGSLIFKLGLRAKRATCLNEVSLIFTSVQGVRLAIVDLRPIGLPTHLAAEENWVVTGTIDSVPFVEGSYNAGIYVGATNYLENHFDLTTLSVESRPDKSGYAPYPVAYQGLINLKFSASIDARPSEP